MASFWYQSGTILEAIAESRRSSKLFMVYISGTTEDSKKMDQFWEVEKVQSLCKPTCVALRLSAESEECKQFSAIYPVLSIPSVYFIDNSGKILEALALQSTVEEFVSKIAKVTEPYKPVEETGAVASTSHSQPQNAESTVQRSSTEANGDTKEEDSSDHFEEKVKKVREKEAKQDSKYEQQRREWGKSAQQFKDAQRESQMKRDIEERKAEKLEEKAARERVKKQIEQDKLDRAARFQQEKSERLEAATKKQADKHEKAQKEIEMKEAEKHSHARLQFRVPDGSTLVHRFDAGDPLRSAYDFVVSQNLPLLTSITSFSLSLAYPRRVFSDTDLSLSFSELGMVPSASLIILPRQGKVVAASSPVSTDGIFAFFFFILMIPVRILSYIWSFISSQPSAHLQSSSQETGSSGSISQRESGESSVRFRRQGHMTRFGNAQGDDDDDATWNGNSTQQM